MARLILLCRQFATASTGQATSLLLLLFLLLMLLGKLAAHAVAALQISTVHRGLPQYHDDNAPSRHQFPGSGAVDTSVKEKRGRRRISIVDIRRPVKAVAGAAIVPIRSRA